MKQVVLLLTFIAFVSVGISVQSPEILLNKVIANVLP